MSEATTLEARLAQERMFWDKERPERRHIELEAHQRKILDLLFDLESASMRMKELYDVVESSLPNSTDEDAARAVLEGIQALHSKDAAMLWDLKARCVHVQAEVQPRPAPPAAVLSLV